MEATATQTASTNNSKATAANAVITIGGGLHTALHIASELVKIGTASLACSIDNTLDKQEVSDRIQATSELRFASMQDRIAAIKAKNANKK